MYQLNGSLMMVKLIVSLGQKMSVSLPVSSCPHIPNLFVSWTSLKILTSYVWIPAIEIKPFAYVLQLQYLQSRKPCSISAAIPTENLLATKSVKPKARLASQIEILFLTR